MLRRMFCVLAVVCLIATACSQDDSATNKTLDPSTTAAPVTTTTTVPTTVTQRAVAVGCDEPLAVPGEYEGLGMFGDVEQPYWIVVPDTYAENAPVPLYVRVASGSGSHDVFMEGWRPYLDDLDGLMVMANTASYARGEADALASLIDQISSEYCVDAERVHVMGESHSFGMSEELVCAYSDKIASFITALGRSGSECTPDRPVPLLSFTGDTDRSGVHRLVDRWVEINGCDPEPIIDDLGSGVQRKTYQNCEADVVLYDIEGMRHYWPMHEAKGPGASWIAEYEEVDYLEEAYKFFAEHPLP